MAKKEQKSLFRRLTQVFRSGPIVKRKIRSFDTTLAMADKTKSSGALLFQKSLSPTYATITSNAYNLSERLMRYQDFCFGRETIVYTLDGAFTIEELSKKYPSGEQFFVYSYDYENKIPTIGKAFFPRIVDGGSPKKRLKITFDDGGFLYLTPDHKLILRDGSTREAKDLNPGDSMMPLYVSDINDKGYNWVYMLGKKEENYVGGWLQEHVFVASNLIKTPKTGEHVHHKDFNKKNNHPSNLVIMSEHDHMKYHSQLNNKNKFGKSNLSHSNWMRLNGNRRDDVTFESIVQACNTLGSTKASDITNHFGVDINLIKLRLKEFGFLNWKDFSSRFSEAQSISTHEIIKKESKSPALQEIIDVTIRSKTLDEVASTLSCTRNAINRRLESVGYKSWIQLKTGKHYDGKKRGPCISGPTYQDICSKYSPGMTKLELAEACNTTHNKIMTRIKNEGYVSYANWTNEFKNHKVVSVEEAPEDIVFNITVEKYHNLAVGSLSPKDPKKRQHSLVFATQCEMEYCLHGDTKIAIPGGYKTIAELAKECEGKPDHTFLVYAYDHNLQRIVPAFGKQARQTRIDVAYTVTFDNGQKIVGTPNHRLMKRDGTYCKIEDLKTGDAMMPFYRKDLYSGCKEEGDGYRWIYSMDRRSKTNGWVSEHRIIGEMLKGSPLADNEVVHHRNFIKHDNRPENLQVMTDEAHRRLHAEILNGAKWSESNSNWINQFKINHSKFMKDNNPAERKDITFGRILEIAERVGFNSKKICEILDTDPNVIKRRLRKHGYQNFEIFAKAYNPDWQNNGWDNKGEKNPRYVKSITFDKICSHFSKGMSREQVAQSLGTTQQIIENRIKERGYKNYAEFASSYDNLKVVSVEHYGVIPLYDLTVDGYKNFATDTVISHNTPEIASALDIYADEACASDDKGRTLHIYSDNEKIRGILEDLFYNTLNVEFNLRSWARNLVKYGDFFLYNDVSPEYGVVNAFPIPVNEIEREENFDREDPFAVRYRWVSLGNRTLENWEVTHFRLLGNDTFLPYGSSVIEPARRIWRQLILIEDAMLVYRVVRAPERRVFYIDVANVPPENVPLYVEEQRKNLRTSQVIDNTTGRVDLRYNPLSVDEDYFIPVRGSETGTKIDTLAGGQNIAAVEDVAYIQKKLFAALKIPRAYLGYDEMLSSKATLAQEDIRFSRTINVIQKTMLAELNKLAIIHLYAHGYDNEDLQNFTLRLSNPSTIAQQQKLELWRTKFEIGGSLPDGMGSRKFVQREIWGLNDEQIDEINAQRLREKLTDDSIDSATAAGGGEGGAGGEDIFGSEEAPEPEEETGGEASEEGPGEENAGEEPEEESSSELELLTSSEDHDDDEDYSLKVSSDDKPIKAKNQLKKALYNRSRRRTHGASKTHIPDFAKMTGLDNESMKDPVGNNWMKSVVSNPFGESRANVSIRHNLTPDMLSTLRQLSTKISPREPNSQRVLNENEVIGELEIDDDDV